MNEMTEQQKEKFRTAVFSLLSDEEKQTINGMDPEQRSLFFSALVRKLLIRELPNP